MITGKVTGIFTKLPDGETYTKELLYEIRTNSKGKPVFQLLGGSTGYEGFWITKEVIEDYFERPDAKVWLACLGTNYSWPRLEIPIEDMRKALEPFREKKQELDDY